MGDTQFDDIGACVFDAYGTLFDVHAAAEGCREALGDKTDDLSALWRQKQLQYTWLRSLMRHHEDFWTVTSDALDYAMKVMELDDPGLRARLMELYLTLDAYPDAVETLGKLKEARIKTAILSNGSLTMLVAAAKSGGIYELLDAIISVDRVGVYKPDPSVYQLAVDELKVAANRISFQSANAWDASGAAAFGMRVAWINRFDQPAEMLPGTPNAELTALSELPALLDL